MGINNDAVRQCMNDLFTEEKAESLRNNLGNLSPQERELEIIEKFAQAIKQETDSNYVLPFRFKSHKADRTSHHLIFVTKNIKGYKIMKEVMAKKSSEQNQGVGTFEYNPTTEKQPLLFELSRPLDELQDLLLQEFKGQTLTMKQIYQNHHVGTPYIKSNYKKALNELELNGKIKANPPASERRMQKGKKTFADKVQVTFL